ncbi:MAG: hypothetical protein RLN72_00010 [Henriciella sp.]
MAAAAAAGFLTLSGCVIAVDADDDVHSNWDMHHDYSALKGADIGPDFVMARVSSNGCTTKDFIGTDVRKTGDDSFSVGFYREKADYCRAMLPEGVALTWTFAELGIPQGAEVNIRNSVGN